MRWLRLFFSAVVLANGFTHQSVLGAVNVAPSFTKGPDQTVLEDAGKQTVPAWATDLSAGPANEKSQTLSFVVSTDNKALFSGQPAISPSGTLTTLRDPMPTAWPT